MATDDIERLHYYQRQYLGAQDFEDQQAYHRDMRRRLNLAHHTWGIVTGLELVANGSNVNITPGMAIDGFGREIVMFTPTSLDPALFRAFHGVGYHTVCLEYTEALTQSPQAGYGQCDPSNQLNQFSRVGENFQVVVQDSSRDDIMVNGQAIVFLTDPNNPKNFFINIPSDTEDSPILSASTLTPSTENMLLPLDESVPYQELPTDDPTIPIAASWLIPLGQVWWDGTTGVQQFSGAVNDDGRHYIGSVASRLLTPARNLVVRDRNTNVPLPPVDPKHPDGVVMSIEGTLQVDRLLTAKDNVEMDGGALDFRNTGGFSDGINSTTPMFTISRQGTDTTSGIAIQIQIGQDQAGKNSFAVSSSANPNLFWVNDQGNAHLAGSMDGLSITGALDFGSQPRQMIDLWTSQDKKSQNAFGIQATGAGGSPPTSATTYFRSSNDFYWYMGGSYSSTPGIPGAGGTVLMQLSMGGGLNVNAPLTVTGNLNVGGATVFTGDMNVNGSLVVKGLSLAFQSTANANFSVTLGTPRAFVHGADSIYGIPNLWLDTDGAVIAKQGFRMSPMNGAAFFKTGTPAPNNGDVVVLDTTANDGSVIPSHKANDSAVIGVAITNPGFILANQPYSSTPEGTLVALIGVVQCNVDNTGGFAQINVGTLLTTGTNGQATIGTPTQGTVFGKALEFVPPFQQKTIKVLLMPS